MFRAATSRSINAVIMMSSQDTHYAIKLLSLRGFQHVSKFLAGKYPCRPVGWPACFFLTILISAACTLFKLSQNSCSCLSCLRTDLANALICMCKVWTCVRIGRGSSQLSEEPLLGDDKSESMSLSILIQRLRHCSKLGILLPEALKSRSNSCRQNCN